VQEESSPSKTHDIKTSILFKDFGQALFFLYEPIIFYNFLGKRIELVLLYYGLQILLYALCVSDGAKIMSKIGIKKSMIFATFFLILYNAVLLYFSKQNLTINSAPLNSVIWFGLLAIICTIYQMLYWPSFYTDISLFMKNEQSGRDIGKIYFFMEITYIIAPIIGGFILVKFGIITLLIFSSIITSLSVIPLFKGENQKPSIILNFKQIIRELFNKDKITYLLPFYAEGISECINNIFWGLFVYLIVGNIMELGFLSSGVALFTAAFVLIIGRIIDKYRNSHNKILRVGVITSSVGWLLKGLPVSTILFFVFDNIQKFGNSIVRVPFEKTMYKRFKYKLNLADEYVVLREVAYSISGGLSLILLAFIIWKFNFTYAAFIIASISTTIYLLMKKESN